MEETLVVEPVEQIEQSEHSPVDNFLEKDIFCHKDDASKLKSSHHRFWEYDEKKDTLQIFGFKQWVSDMIVIIIFSIIISLLCGFLITGIRTSIKNNKVLNRLLRNETWQSI
jgi:hypothetical protein